MFLNRFEYSAPLVVLLCGLEGRLCQDSLDGDIEDVHFEEWGESEVL